MRARRRRARRSSVDQPLKLLRDAAQGREYLACDFNRDGDSYR
jgi:capping protein beta